MISLLGNRLMSTLVSAILLANFAAAIDDCRDDFAALDFDLLSFDKYPSYFRSDSKLEVIVASEQTGEYVGTAAIEEYILVLTDSNMQESQEAFVDMKLIDIDDDSTTCTFELAKKLEPENATGAKTAGGETLITVVYDYSARYIPLIRILSVPPVNKQSESKQSEDEPSELIFILVGFTAPALVMLAVFLLVKRKPSHDQQRRTSIASKDARSNPLLQKRAKNIRIVILVTFLALLIANGLAGLIVWWAAKEFNWETMEQPDHRSDALSFTETVPQANLSDSDFGVYTGFVVWLTCIISAFGLEIFVWREFLQEWTPLHERAWRFAQFIFPLLALVSFGLAGQGNFLCLPFCVVGFWKFGFPEAFMLLYLGLHGKRSSQKRRLVDFLNGIGTVIHHGAASMIISMFVSGVCPATPLVRYATNVVLLLTMQHWAVLLKYVHEPSYAAVSLGIEFYFEWSVFSDLAQIYHLHWVLALGSVVMLFAHWLYLLAALAGLCDPEHLDHRDNVFVRGNALIFEDINTSDRTMLVLLDDTEPGLGSDRLDVESNVVAPSEEKKPRQKKSQGEGKKPRKKKSAGQKTLSA